MVHHARRVDHDNRLAELDLTQGAGDERVRATGDNDPALEHVDQRRLAHIGEADDASGDALLLSLLGKLP